MDGVSILSFSIAHAPSHKCFEEMPEVCSSGEMRERVHMPKITDSKEYPGLALPPSLRGGAAHTVLKERLVMLAKERAHPYDASKTIIPLFCAFGKR